MIGNHSKLCFFSHPVSNKIKIQAYRTKKHVFAIYEGCFPKYIIPGCNKLASSVCVHSYTQT